MSAYQLGDEQRGIRELARRVVDDLVMPHAAAWDRDHHFPGEVLSELGRLGLMGVCIPTDYGGAGADFLSYVLVIEELSRGDAGLGVTVAVHTGAATLPIALHGTKEQIDRFVPPLAAGDELAAFALTEADAGSDASSIRTYVKDGRITGSKQWITNGSYASTFLVFAREAAAGITAYLVRMGSEGFGSRARRTSSDSTRRRPLTSNSPPRRPRDSESRVKACGSR
jgi:alkylation response protein AidB-like acyl-CoA dehydrogenase